MPDWFVRTSRRTVLSLTLVEPTGSRCCDVELKIGSDVAVRDGAVDDRLNSRLTGPVLGLDRDFQCGDMCFAHRDQLSRRDLRRSSGMHRGTC